MIVIDSEGVLSWSPHLGVGGGSMHASFNFHVISQSNDWLIISVLKMNHYDASDESQTRNWSNEQHEKRTMVRLRRVPPSASATTTIQQQRRRCSESVKWKCVRCEASFDLKNGWRGSTSNAKTDRKICWPNLGPGTVSSFHDPVRKWFCANSFVATWPN